MTKEEIKQINDTTWVRKTTILVTLFFSWILVFFAFFAPPLGVIDNSVMMIFGECGIFIGCALGLKEYADRTIFLLNKHINKDDKQENC